MSRRPARGSRNAIRGPQSALTDFLASHNISAAQIRSNYEERLRNYEETNVTATGGQPEQSEQEVQQSEESASSSENQKKRKRDRETRIAKIKKDKEKAKKEEQKNKKKGKKSAGKKPLGGDDDEDDDDDSDDGDDEDIWNMYKKAKPMPGQLENCEDCGKRFTVTPYSKTGTNGGLLCSKCSKEIEAVQKKEAKVKRAEVSREKRRKVQSKLLDGNARYGAKTLGQLCVEKVAENINDVEEFGDIPPKLLDNLSEVLSKKRLFSSKILDLFLRPDVDSIAVYDCGRLETTDYIRLFASSPHVEKIDLRNAGQMKDVAIDDLIKRKVPLQNIRLDAANLITEEKWKELFSFVNKRLKNLSLSWLDFALNDETVMHAVTQCPNVEELKLKKCFKISDVGLESLAKLTALRDLSLSLMVPISTDVLLYLIESVGANLERLSLRKFHEADDRLLEVVRLNCVKLFKLCITDNDCLTDAAIETLFTEWGNPPLQSACFSGSRDAESRDAPANSEDSEDENNIPREQIGMASNGFKALMRHSGQRLERLNVSSCRHISREALYEVFDGSMRYPMLKEIDMSFVSKVDTLTIAGIFASCPSIERVAAFGCFEIKDIIVPNGVALIGVPTAQSGIVQEGGPSDALWGSVSAIEVA